MKKKAGNGLTRLTGPRKLLFYGNCQAQVTAKAIALMNPGISVEYAGNSERVSEYDPERSLRLMDWCDVIVSQPIMNKQNPDRHEVLSDRFGDRLIFMPYVYFDAFFSLYFAPYMVGKLRSGVVGEAPVIAELNRVGYAETVKSFIAGNLDFKHRARLQYNFAETDKREALCRIKLGPYIRENYTRFQMLLTHNHPVPVVMNEFARQVAQELKLQFTPITPDNPQHYHQITLDRGWDFISPFATADLGLDYPYDLHWVAKGTQLIGMVAKALDIPVE